ncbi:hypothetical protein [Bradyrhizobium sp. RD5-C2]|uniref:hypothetical protein n=1 Tax=Bradyrhizobium sp. RD5-C2 TaxID=244562 RepID=UPI001CC6948C|nr:hypothetical protein [Bradyrhizobium sp. RD5-C2]GIQ78903.1 hypothetical protein BraRD5C2_73550 [Bradyrhizobium sp. RD5-C2]
MAVLSACEKEYRGDYYTQKQATHGGLAMSRHNKMPPIPPANRSNRGTGGEADVKKDTSSKKAVDNFAEQGDTANVKQNTTNAGFFKGRRVK